MMADMDYPRPADVVGLRPDAKRRLLDLAMWKTIKARQPFTYLDELWRNGLCIRQDEADGIHYRINEAGLMAARKLYRDGHRNTKQT